jgi:hypothetical protein
MKNVTVIADERDVASARDRARAEDSTLNDKTRAWAEGFLASEEESVREFIKRIQSYARTTGRKLTRDDLNDRDG